MENKIDIQTSIKFSELFHKQYIDCKMMINKMNNKDIHSNNNICEFLYKEHVKYISNNLCNTCNSSE